MSLKTVIKFLEEKPGYIKSGAGRVASLLKEDEEVCREAISQVRKSYKGKTLTKHPDMKVRRMWKYPGAKEWGISLENENQVNLEELDKVIEKAIKNSPKFIPNKVKTNDKGENELLIYLSDQHIGAEVKESQYENYYNSEEVVRRFSMLFGQVIKLSYLVRIDKIKVILLGDSLDGMDGYTVSRTHPIPQNMTNQEALECFLSSHIGFINSLSTICNQIDLHLTCNSNHGGDFEYAAHRALQLYYRNTNYVNTFLYTKFLSHFETKKYCFIITHGKDKKNRKSGLPKHLNPDTEVFLQQYIIENKIIKPVRVIKGDLHVNTFEDGKLVTYKNVPSFFGGSPWIMDNYGKTKAGVAFELCTKDFLLADTFKIL